MPARKPPGDTAAFHRQLAAQYLTLARKAQITMVTAEQIRAEEAKDARNHIQRHESARLADLQYYQTARAKELLATVEGNRAKATMYAALATAETSYVALLMAAPPHTV
jgi:hypothetical protein